MNDREFDALLESAAPELPPDDVARDVTPWRRAIGNILGGSAMCSITLNFFCLNYLLPTIGVILQLLGFRPLRRENGWFRACWLLAVLRAALFLPCIVLNATIYSNAVYASSVGTALTYAMLAVQMLLFFCFWQALRAMQKKAGTGGGAAPAAALLIWYAAVLTLAYVQYSGLLLGLAMLGCYILILRSLFRLSREMEESGYALTPAPVHLSDEMLVRAIAALLAVGMPMSAPCVIANGAAIYDFRANEYLYTAFLGKAIYDHMAEVLARFPTLAFEVYHDDCRIHAMNPNRYIRNHEHLTRSPVQVVERFTDIDLPIIKILFEEDFPVLDAVRTFILSRPWGREYELIYSNEHLLELTAAGATKGGMILRLASLLGVARKDIYCIGDHKNDIPMLEVSAVPFAPANAIPAVHEFGAHIVSHCSDGAVADVVEYLDKIY